MSNQFSPCTPAEVISIRAVINCLTRSRPAAQCCGEREGGRGRRGRSCRMLMITAATRSPSTFVFPSPFFLCPFSLFPSISFHGSTETWLPRSLPHRLCCLSCRPSDFVFVLPFLFVCPLLQFLSLHLLPHPLVNWPVSPVTFLSCATHTHTHTHTHLPSHLDSLSDLSSSDVPLPMAVCLTRFLSGINAAVRDCKHFLPSSILQICVHTEKTNRQEGMSTPLEVSSVNTALLL